MPLFFLRALPALNFLCALRAFILLRALLAFIFLRALLALTGSHIINVFGSIVLIKKKRIANNFFGKHKTLKVKNEDAFTIFFFL